MRMYVRRALALVLAAGVSGCGDATGPIEHRTPLVGEWKGSANGVAVDVFFLSASGPTSATTSNYQGTAFADDGTVSNTYTGTIGLVRGDSVSIAMSGNVSALRWMFVDGHFNGDRTEVIGTIYGWTIADRTAIILTKQ